VYVEVAADDDRTVVDSELFEHRRQIIEERVTHRLMTPPIL